MKEIMDELLMSYLYLVMFGLLAKTFQSVIQALSM